MKQSKVLWLPAPASRLSTTLLRAALGLTAVVALGLASCDSTAKFTVLDTQFADLQVVAAFPARVEENGSIVRVCGDVLPGDEAVEPNGVELNIAMMSNGLKKTACRNAGNAPDRDRSIKDGDLIDLTRINSRASLGLITVAPQHFTMHLDCIHEHGPGKKADCASGVSNADLPGVALRYSKLADRCSPQVPETWVNVAVLVDHTGSISGLVDGNTQLEDDPGKLEPTLPITEQIKSDPFNQRLTAVDNFLSLLNDTDRAGVWYFDEDKGVDVGCSDAYICQGGASPGGKCPGPGSAQCGTGTCVDDPSNANDTFTATSFSGPGPNRQNACFGRLETPFRRDWFRNGLLSKAKHAGVGRAPLWHATNELFKFMSGTAAEGNAGVSGPKHIVIVTDGPDTCTDSENFNYRDLTGKSAKGICRTKCAQAGETDFKKLRDDMVAKNWPVVLHFVHFQSPANRYKVPDARMQELACRSGGTYQFINTEEVNKSDPNAYAVVTTAMSRIRSVLSGSWRVGFKHSELKPAGAALPVGKMMSLEGYAQFKNVARFPSLNAVYTDSQAWRFGFTGLEDHRLTYRSACSEDKDCGGTSECGANRCLSSGLCESAPAENQQACSKGKCCAGKCESTKCDLCK